MTRNQRGGLFVVLLVIVGLGLWRAYEAFMKLPVLGKFLVCLVLATVLGAVFAKLFLPRFGEWVVRFLFSWNDPPPGPGDEKAEAIAVLMAQGDYQGVLATYEERLKADPHDAHAVCEMAKVQAERLEDPARAMAFLEHQLLASAPWPPAGDAMLRMRLVELYLAAGRKSEAERLLEHIIAHYPGTPHSGAAHRRLHELRPRVVPVLPAAWDHRA